MATSPTTPAARLSNGDPLASADPKLVQAAGAPLLTDNGGPTPTIAFQAEVADPAAHAGYQDCASTDGSTCES